MRRVLIICMLMSFVSVYPQSLKITGYEGPVTEGSVLQLQATLSPANAAYNTYTWSSTNTTVATVNGNGLVTAVSEGTTTIKCVLSAEYSGTQYFAPPSPITATCAITIVKEKAKLITFADSNVKRICVNNWDTDGDGELSFEEAAAVTDIGTVFKSKKDITTFNELAFFSGLMFIADGAFSYCSGLTSIVIPNSVTSIGNNAFYKCSSLNSVIIPDSLTSIGESAFYGCEVLPSLILPQSLSIIGQHAFSYCNAMVAIDIPNSVISIGDYAFDRCRSLTSVTLSSSLTSIGSCTFYGCSSLIAMTIPNSVTSIGGAAFSGCKNLTSLSLSSVLKTIGKLAFEGCSGLTSVTIPKSVTSIGDNVFYGCSGLETIIVEGGNTQYDSRENCNALIETTFSNLVLGCKNTNIPKSVKTISDYAFYHCTGLTSVTIPGSVTAIGNMAFYGCSNLTSVIVEISVPLSIKGDVFSNRTNAMLYVPRGSKEAYETTDYWKEFKEIVEKGIEFSDVIAFADMEVKRICVNNWDTDGDGELSYTEAAAVADIGLAFKENKSIKNFNELSYFTGLTSISDYAFYDCSLVSVIIPNSVKKIGNAAFYGCGALSSINIPDSVTLIDVCAFSGCNNLTSIVIPKSVTSIKTYAFSECECLKKIVVADENTIYDSREDCNAVIETASNTLVVGCKNTFIPNTVTSIAGGAFYKCSSLSSVTIPNSITSIGGSAFYGCQSLTSIIIPDSVTSIENIAFYGCTNLNSVTIGKGVTNLGNSVFYGCDKLKHVTVKWKTPIGNAHSPFNNSNWQNAILYVPYGTKEVYMTADWNNFKEIVETAPESSDILIFPDAEVKRICVENWDTNGDGDLSFGEAAAVTDLGQVFKGNDVITSFVELQYFTGLTSIGDRAFDNCNNLTNVRLPEGISSIGLGAFLHCDLQSIYIPASVKEIGIYPFVHNSNLTSIQVDAANMYYDSRNECNAIIETSSNTLIQGCKTTVIPSGIKKIGNFAFEFVDLEHIDLPQGLEEISWCAFYGCANLGEVAFPDGLKSIGRFAYNGCTNLESIVIPASTTYVSGASFAGCYNIETLRVAPESETYISPDGSNAVVSKDGTTLVAGCKNTIIPETVMVIGSECFYDQKNLTTISIPVLVTTIEDYAFCGCISLTEIDIPKNVETIGEYAFSGSRIVSVTVRREVPIAITANVFTNRSNSILYVPFGCKAAYEAAHYWKDFKEIVEMSIEEPSGTIDVTDISQLADAIYIEPILAGVGSDTKIEICLKNAHAATAYVFDLVLPDGVTVATNSNGKFIDALSNRHDGHSRTFNYKGNNTYSLATISGNSEELSGNDGAIRLLTLHVADGMSEGTYAINITNASYSMPDATLVTLENTTSSITVKNFIMGDVNGNDEVDIGDAVSVVNYLVGKEVQTFMEMSADTNKNGIVDIGDAVIIVNYLVGEVERLSRKHIIWDEREPQ